MKLLLLLCRMSHVEPITQGQRRTGKRQWGRQRGGEGKSAHMQGLIRKRNRGNKIKMLSSCSLSLFQVSKDPTSVVQSPIRRMNGTPSADVESTWLHCLPSLWHSLGPSRVVFQDRPASGVHALNHQMVQYHLLFGPFYDLFLHGPLCNQAINIYL